MSDFGSLRALAAAEATRVAGQPSDSREAVYVIAAGDINREGTPVKIGFTRGGAWARLAMLQANHYATLSLYAVVPGGPTLEAALHELLAEERLRGEWFRSSAALRNVVASVVNAVGETHAA